VKKTAAFGGTPGTLFAVVCQHARGCLVVIDRKADTWERVYEGEHRYAIMHEPSRRATTVTSVKKAREEVERVSALVKSEFAAEIDQWWAAATV
jgi:hypothetical protein